MAKHDKLISVIMSTYNETEIEIKQSIESILNQTWQEFEFIIVHDNPKNKILEILLREYEKKDRRIKVFKNENNIGLAKSMNFALKQTKGVYIARMDADDISMPERLEKEVKQLERYSLDMVSANRINISETGEEIERQKSCLEQCDIKELLPYKDIIVHPSVLLKRKVLEEVGGYRNFMAAQDYDLWLRMLTFGYKIGVLDEPLIYYRIRQASVSQSKGYKQFLMAKYARTLFRQRKRQNGKDSFSEENMKNYLAKRYTERRKEKFGKGREYLEYGAGRFKSNHKLIGCSYMLKAVMTSGSCAEEFLYSLKYWTKKNQLLRKKKK